MSSLCTDQQRERKREREDDDEDDDFFCVSDIVGDRMLVSTLRGGTVFGSAPGVSTRLTPNRLARAGRGPTSSQNPMGSALPEPA